MRLMTTILLAGFVSLGCAQDDLFQKAPPAVDAALRPRVSKFYQAHVNAKFRVADTVVAEEAKDEFFAMAKPVYQTFEIIKINYSANFTKATVVTVVKRELTIRGNKFPAQAPVTSTWKVIDGQWFWYVDEMASKELATPMGTMHPGPPSGRPEGMPKDFSAMMEDPKRREALVQSLLKKVSVNKTEIVFPADKAAAETVEITNSLDGPIKLEMVVNGKPAGLTATVDSLDVAAGGKTMIRLKYVPGKEPAKGTANLVISVQQTAQVFDIPVRFPGK